MREACVLKTALPLQYNKESARIIRKKQVKGNINENVQTHNCKQDQHTNAKENIDIRRLSYNAFRIN